MRISRRFRPLLLLGALALLGSCATSSGSGADPAGAAAAPAGEPAAPKHHGEHHGQGKHHGQARHQEPGEHRGHGKGHGKGQGHGHGHHRFVDPEAWARRFDDPARDAWQKPEAVVAAMKLQPAMKVADIGAGTGYFAVRFARAVPRGQVFGIDVEPKMVTYLDQRAKKEGLDNLRGQLATFSDARVPEPVDRIFLCNTYHHIEGRPAYFRALLPKLTAGGWLVVVDYKMGELPHGPPESMRVTPEQLEQELGEAGYQRVSLDTETLPHQYVAIYRAK